MNSTNLRIFLAHLKMLLLVLICAQISLSAPQAVDPSCIHCQELPAHPITQGLKDHNCLWKAGVGPFALCTACTAQFLLAHSTPTGFDSFFYDHCNVDALLIVDGKKYGAAERAMIAQNFCSGPGRKFCFLKAPLDATLKRYTKYYLSQKSAAPFCQADAIMLYDTSKPMNFAGEKPGHYLVPVLINMRLNAAAKNLNYLRRYAELTSAKQPIHRSHIISELQDAPLKQLINENQVVVWPKAEDRILPDSKKAIALQPKQHQYLINHQGSCVYKKLPEKEFAPTKSSSILSTASPIHTSSPPAVAVTVP